MYQRLSRLVRTGAAVTTGVTDDPPPRGGRDPRAVTRPGVTLTWLLRDVEPWRIDRVFLHGQDTTWIATRSWSSPGSIWDSAVTWHRPTRGRALRRALGELGLAQAAVTGGTLEQQLDAAARANADRVEAATAPEEQAPEPEPTSGAADEAADEGAAPAAASPGQLLDGALWGVAGLVAGVLLTLGWQRRRGTGPDQPEPAEELVLAGPGVDRMEWDPSLRR